MSTELPLCACGCGQRVARASNTYASRRCCLKARWPNGAKPLPFCECGCGRRVKRRGPRYASPQCVPSTVRSEGAKNGRRLVTFKRRRLFFEAEMRRLREFNGRIPAPELMATFQAIADRMWDNGYHACECKWQRRMEVNNELLAPRTTLSVEEDVVWPDRD